MIRRLFFISIIGVFGAAAAGDQMARVYAEHQIEQRADNYFEHTNGSSAHISSFPFVVRLAASGEVPHIRVSVYGVTLERLFLRRITLKFDDVKLDRNLLFKRKVKLRDLKKGTVAVDIDGKSIAERIGRDIRFKKGSVEVHQTVAGKEVVATGSISISNNLLAFHPRKVEGVNLPGAGAALAFTYQIPKSELFPCAARVEPVEGGVLAECTVDKIPPGLVGEIPTEIPQRG